jgi:acyl carrier protein
MLVMGCNNMANFELATREDILNTLKQVMADLFDTDPEAVTLEANLYTDLDIDSIDAVDLVMKIREITGKKLGAEDFKNVRLVSDVIDAIEDLLKA